MDSPLETRPRRPGLRDLLAGCELAAIGIPQVLGYARIAGLPIVTGLYTLLLPLSVFALAGSSTSLVVSADSATAALLAGALSGLEAPGSAQYVALATMTAALTAACLLVARAFKLGFLADFLSYTVLVGFLAGVGVQLALKMLGRMIGLPAEVSPTHLLDALPHLHRPTVALALGVVAFLLILRRWMPRVPGPLLAVVASIGASWAFDFSSQGIVLLDSVTGGLPALTLPHASWAEIERLVPLSLSCMVMILAQSSATARFYAAKHSEDLDENKDLVALALANFGAALTGTFVVNGSPTTTTLLDRAGGRAPWAHLTASLVVIIVLLALTGPLRFLPQAVLGAVVFVIALGLIDLKAFKSIRQESKGEFALALTTLVAVVALGPEKGILVAIALSMLRILWHTYHPHTGVLVVTDTPPQLRPATPGTVSQPGLIIYRFGAALYFANVGLFCAEIRALLATTRSNPSQPSVKRLVIDAEAISKIDYSAARAVHDLVRQLRDRGIDVAIARIPPLLRADLDRHHLTETIGADHYFQHLHEASTGA